MATGLATRCTACGTVFRVVPDQLRVSEGWVRCGRCAEVFNAALALVDIETGAPRRLSEPAHGPEASSPAPASGSAPPSWPEPQFAPADHARAQSDIADPADADMPDDPPVYPAGRISAVDIDFDPAASGAEILDGAPSPEFGRSSQDLDEAGGKLDPPFDAAPDAGGSDPTQAAEAPGLEGSAGALAGSGSDLRGGMSAQPSFLRQADRARRWRQPGVRAALAVVFGLGLLGLVAQVTYEWRDLVGARFAAARPALDRVCAVLGCTVDAPHLIDSLAVDSSGLLRVERSNVYKLSVSLRNRGDLEAAVPAIDLSLTDSQGKLLARRVLRAAELGASQASLGPGRELALRATLQAATDTVAGYTIEIFYP